MSPSGVYFDQTNKHIIYDICLHGLSGLLPIRRDLLLYPGHDVFNCARLAERVNELAIRVHEVEEY